MKVYEINLKLYLLQNLLTNEALERIRDLIDKSLVQNEKYLEFHNKNKFKHYTFNSLFNAEKPQVFKEGGIYLVKVRTIDGELAEYLTKNLGNEYTDYIKALTVETKLLKRRPIEKIYNLTPTVIKTDKGYWKGNLSMEDYERRIKENLIKKYNHFFNIKLDEDFELFRSIEFNNRKPVRSSYKTISLLGDKLTLYIAENDTAQALAYFALGTGIGEMNSRGFGFVNYKPI